MAMPQQRSKAFGWTELATFFASALVGFGAGAYHRDYAIFVIVAVLTYVALSILHLAVAFATGTRKPRWWDVLTDLMIMIS